jgi:S-formylglutathione hydrolase
METLAEHRCFGGVQGFYRHQSTATGTPMKFGVFTPPGAKKVPVVYFLAGLTCTEETFAIKAGAQQAAAELGLALVTCDTTPRDLGIPNETAAWDFGAGAGFYLDATQAPWASAYSMESYVLRDLRAVVHANFPVDPGAEGLFGHSMGGHGALTLGVKNPGIFKSLSAFAPISAPTWCPWGVKAFTGYLGSDQASWAAYDAALLIEGLASAKDRPALLVDQGLADKFLEAQLHPHLLEAACQKSGYPLTLRRHDGYDHGYFFIASFVADHLRHHARTLKS